MLGDYLDFQAEVGITKHMGGLPATRELLSLCHIEEAREVLDVGCGIGVGPARIARAYGCHVVGVDGSPKMIEWARQRVREEGVQDRVDLRVADVLALPFEADRFDVVLCESVLGFVGDKEKAVRELVRVARPGGYVGINESLWIGGLSPEMRQLASDLGVEVVGSDVWRALLERSGLHDEIVRLRRVEAVVEVRSRLRWIGLPWAVRAWGRVLRLYITRPAIRAKLRAFFGSGAAAFESTGYGLFVGRKAALSGSA